MLEILFHNPALCWAPGARGETAYLIISATVTGPERVSESMARAGMGPGRGRWQHMEATSIVGLFLWNINLCGFFPFRYFNFSFFPSIKLSLYVPFSQRLLTGLKAEVVWVCLSRGTLQTFLREQRL